MSSSHQPTYYLLKERIPASETPTLLGRIVRNFHDPLAICTPWPFEHVPASTLEQFVSSPQIEQATTIILAGSKSTRLSTALNGILSTDRSRNAESETRIEAAQIVTERLKREDEFYDFIRNIPKVRERMNSVCPQGPGSKAYMIVGVKSFNRAKVMTSSVNNTSSGNAGAITFPGGFVRQTSLIETNGVVRSDTSEIRVHAYGSVSTSVEATVIAAGKPQIDGPREAFAISYRIISRSWTGRGFVFRGKNPEYRGGLFLHPGSLVDCSNSGDDDDDDDDVFEEEEDGFDVVMGDYLSLDVGMFGGREPVWEKETGFLFHP